MYNNSFSSVHSHVQSAFIESKNKQASSGINNVLLYKSSMMEAFPWVSQVLSLHHLGSHTLSV